ncbi:MAG: glycine cleavage system protein GcvH [Spirochaetota bacterium]|jgi:glycine cleavage system H protein|nr:glycine cleavage system protein GcvH [Spirochaetota bacterium]
MGKPEELKFLKSHEWVRVEGNTAFVGISDYAQEELGDIVFVELPEVGDEFEAGEEVTNVESVKAASPIYAPVSGKITKVNEELEDTPELVNQKPYDAFIYALEMSDASELDDLLSYSDYQKFLEEEAE